MRKQHSMKQSAEKEAKLMVQIQDLGAIHDSTGRKYLMGLKDGESFIHHEHHALCFDLMKQDIRSACK